MTNQAPSLHPLQIRYRVVFGMKKLFGLLLSIFDFYHKNKNVSMFLIAMDLVAGRVHYE